MSPPSEISFTEAYRDKLQEIRDVVTGRKKIKELHFDDTEDTNENYEEKIENLFDTLKKKLLGLNLSDDQNLAKTPIGPAEEKKDVDVATTNGEVKRFYDGTNYSCNQCAKTVYGDLVFKNHLKTVHNVQFKGRTNLSEFSSHHEELFYSCLVCQKIVDHQFKSIYDHLKKTHSLSIVEYESEYLKPSPAVSDMSEDKPLLKKTPMVNILKLKSSELLKYSVSLPPTSSDHKEIPRNMETKSEAKKKLFHQPETPRSENSKKRKSLDIEEAGDSVKVVEVEVELAKEHEKEHEKEQEIDDDDEIVVVYEAPVKAPVLETDPEGRRKKSNTLYYCPITNCKFFTQKEGFKNSQKFKKVVDHLFKIHGIKKEDIKPGRYKFIKVKSEID